VSTFASLRAATEAAVLQGPGTVAAAIRQSLARGDAPPELVSLVQKIRTRAYAVTDQDIDALRDRYTEDQLFEIIVATAFGAADERLTAAHRALDEA
jgi:hypothetical protein